MDGDGVEISSLDRHQVYCQPSDVNTPMAHYSEEAFLLSVTPKLHRPVIIDNIATKTRTWSDDDPEQINSDGLMLRNDSSSRVLLTPIATTKIYSDSSTAAGASSNSLWQHPRFRDHRLQCHLSYSTYLCFIFSFLCATGHHIFYDSLDGKLFYGEHRQHKMNRGCQTGRAEWRAVIRHTRKQRIQIHVPVPEFPISKFGLVSKARPLDCVHRRRKY